MARADLKIHLYKLSDRIQLEEFGAMSEGEETTKYDMAAQADRWQ